MVISQVRILISIIFLAKFFESFKSRNLKVLNIH